MLAMMMMVIIIIIFLHYFIDFVHTFVSFCPSTYILGGVIHSYVLFANSINHLHHFLIIHWTRIMIITTLYYHLIKLHTLELVLSKCIDLYNYYYYMHITKKEEIWWHFYFRCYFVILPFVFFSDCSVYTIRFIFVVL